MKALLSRQDCVTGPSGQRLRFDQLNPLNWPTQLPNRFEVVFAPHVAGQGYMRAKRAMLNGKSVPPQRTAETIN
jgi:hypothetical protein